MCILLVEDEFLIRLLMAEVLQHAGFGVVAAASGDEAIELIRQRHHPFRALVTDYHMPGSADGSRVATFIRQHWPTIPVVIATGRPEVFLPQWNQGFGYSLLRKPYTPSDLVRLIQTLLDAPA